MLPHFFHYHQKAEWLEAQPLAQKVVGLNPKYGNFLEHLSKNKQGLSDDLEVCNISPHVCLFFCSHA